MKKTKKTAAKSAADFACCTSTMGIAHTVLGIGLGLLAAKYIGFVNPLLWGWAFVIVGFVMHFMKEK